MFNDTPAHISSAIGCETKCFDEMVSNKIHEEIYAYNVYVSHSFKYKQRGVRFWVCIPRCEELTPE